MRTLNLSNTTKACDFIGIANEACNILNENSHWDEDFQVDGEDIIEYDLTYTNDPIYWEIIKEDVWNKEETLAKVSLDC